MLRRSITTQSIKLWRQGDVDRICCIELNLSGIVPLRAYPIAGDPGGRHRKRVKSIVRRLEYMLREKGVQLGNKDWISLKRGREQKNKRKSPPCGERTTNYTLTIQHPLTIYPKPRLWSIWALKSKSFRRACHFATTQTKAVAVPTILRHQRVFL